MQAPKYVRVTLIVGCASLMVGLWLLIATALANVSIQQPDQSELYTYELPLETCADEAQALVLSMQRQCDDALLHVGTKNIEWGIDLASILTFVAALPLAIAAITGMCINKYHPRQSYLLPVIAACLSSTLISLWIYLTPVEDMDIPMAKFCGFDRDMTVLEMFFLDKLRQSCWHSSLRVTMQPLAATVISFGISLPFHPTAYLLDQKDRLAAFVAIIGMLFTVAALITTIILRLCFCAPSSSVEAADDEQEESTEKQYEPYDPLPSTTQEWLPTTMEEGNSNSNTEEGDTPAGAIQ